MTTPYSNDRFLHPHEHDYWKMPSKMDIQSTGPNKVFAFAFRKPAALLMRQQNDGTPRQRNKIQPSSLPFFVRSS